MAELITSPANSKMKKLLQLQTKARDRRKEQAFVTEGIRIFLDTPMERIREVYISEKLASQLEGGAPEDSMDERLREKLEEVSYTIVSDPVFAHVCDTTTPQGILCVTAMAESGGEEMTAGTPLLLLLENIQDPGNLGTIFRSAEAAGVTGIIMSKGTVDIYNPKTVRSTMSSIFRMPFMYTEDFAGTMQGLKEKGIRLYAAHLGGRAQYDECDYALPSAFLIGNEGNGLTEESAQAADEKILIPMEGKIESLNAAVASSLLVFEAYRQRRHSMK